MQPHHVLKLLPLPPPTWKLGRDFAEDENLFIKKFVFPSAEIESIRSAST